MNDKKLIVLTLILTSLSDKIRTIKTYKNQTTTALAKNFVPVPN